MAGCRVCGEETVSYLRVAAPVGYRSAVDRGIICENAVSYRRVSLGGVVYRSAVTCCRISEEIAVGDCRRAECVSYCPASRGLIFVEMAAIELGVALVLVIDGAARPGYIVEKGAVCQLRVTIVICDGSPVRSARHRLVVTEYAELECGRRVLVVNRSAAGVVVCCFVFLESAVDEFRVAVSA